MLKEIHGKWMFNENIDLASLPVDYYAVIYDVPVENWVFVPSGHPTEFEVCITITNENISFITETGYQGVLYQNGVWADGYDRVIEMGGWIVDYDNWFEQNATRIDGESVFTPSITYNDISIPLELGKATTLHTRGQKLTDDVVIDSGKDSIIGSWVLNDRLVQDRLEYDKHYRLLFKVMGETGFSSLCAVVECIDDGGPHFYGVGIDLNDLNNADMVYYIDFGGTERWCAMQIEVLSDEADEEAKSWLRANATKL